MQAAFRLDGGNGEIRKISMDPQDGFDVDISEGFAFEMFGISSPRDEVRIYSDSLLLQTSLLPNLTVCI